MSPEISALVNDLIVMTKFPTAPVVVVCGAIVLVVKPSTAAVIEGIKAEAV